MIKQNLIVLGCLVNQRNNSLTDDQADGNSGLTLTILHIQKRNRRLPRRILSTNGGEVQVHDCSCKHAYFREDILPARDFCGSSQKTLTLYLHSLLLKFSF